MPFSTSRGKCAKAEARKIPDIEAEKGSKQEYAAPRTAPVAPGWHHHGSRCVPESSPPDGTMTMLNMRFACSCLVQSTSWTPPWPTSLHQHPWRRNVTMRPDDLDLSPLSMAESTAGGKKVQRCKLVCIPYHTWVALRNGKGDHTSDKWPLSTIFPWDSVTSRFPGDREMTGVPLQNVNDFTAAGLNGLIDSAKVLTACLFSSGRDDLSPYRVDYKASLIPLYI